MFHKRKMLKDNTEETKQCKCRDKCMVDGNCLITNVIFRAKVITLKIVSSMKAYCLKVGKNFKLRFCNKFET